MNQNIFLERIFNYICKICFCTVFSDNQLLLLCLLSGTVFETETGETRRGGHWSRVTRRQAGAEPGHNKILFQFQSNWSFLPEMRENLCVKLTAVILVHLLLFVWFFLWRMYFQSVFCRSGINFYFSETTEKILKNIYSMIKETHSLLKLCRRLERIWMILRVIWILRN